jgi:hypothetical protein
MKDIDPILEEGVLDFATTMQNEGILPYWYSSAIKSMKARLYDGENEEIDPVLEEGVLSAVSERLEERIHLDTLLLNAVHSVYEREFKKYMKPIPGWSGKP